MLKEIGNEWLMDFDNSISPQISEELFYFIKGKTLQ